MKRRRYRDAFCAYCRRGPLVQMRFGVKAGKLGYTDDHIFPQHLDSNTRGRTVPCCFQCNGLKGGLHPAEWFWFIDAFPCWWRDFATHKQVAEAIRVERVRRVWASEPSIIDVYRARRERAYRPKFLARECGNIERNPNE